MSSPSDRYPRLDWGDLEMNQEDLLRTILNELREVRALIDAAADKNTTNEVKR